MAGKHYFVSDLHLFSRRSLAPQYDPAIRNAAAEASTFVLGGDIFDFRWSMLPNFERTLHAAIGWLENLTAHNPRCNFHFVFGNHDYNCQFVAAIDRLASRTTNLRWHRTHLRLGHSLFLHGDVADKPRLCHQKLILRRQKYWHDEEAKGRMANMVYDWAINARLHHMAKLVHRHKRVTDRLLHYVEQIGHGAESGLRHVYFGHTHYAMSHYERGGIFFHNGGAPMKGLAFRIVPVQMGGIETTRTRPAEAVQAGPVEAVG
jgi:UDP-2,3-diacylglucosamine hydrolase